MPRPAPLRFSGAVPVFFSVTLCAAAAAPILVAAKVSLVDDRLTAGAVAMPLRETICGEPNALSAIFSEADSVPAVAGLKMTVMAQDLPAATLPVQVSFVTVKAAALGPVIEV